ncbi:MAG: twin-arginine translocase subunit TatC [Candidatus Firestonebacteria bacterium]
MMTNKSQTVVEHLEELRKRIIICIASFLGLTFFFFCLPSFHNSFSNQIIKYLQNYFLKNILSPFSLKLIFLDPLEPIFVSMKVSALLSVLILIPLFLYQTFAFISPAFTLNKRRQIAWFSLGGIVFFAIGGCISFFLLIPQTFKILIEYGLSTGASPQFTIGKFFNFLLWMFLIFSLPFELPIVLGFLTYTGIISTEKLKSIRKPAYVGIAIFSAVVTPDPTPFSMLILTSILILLYEFGILISLFFKWRENK